MKLKYEENDDSRSAKMSGQASCSDTPGWDVEPRDHCNASLGGNLHVAVNLRRYLRVLTALRGLGTWHEAVPAGGDREYSPP
ncbi:hypothetical protein Afil01_31620 [Actinorhabdospora filicis]|uniref:Uncharacterized protein n=1 Tax=Actinorhabdospora filicis TaxID=1785913 RepID=A0A9W6SJU3_9ACTN|nr:hypothetical protein Afil01_31620 [Actinorhabdospora filicis]